jgi:hypothetical protein
LRARVTTVTACLARHDGSSGRPLLNWRRRHGDLRWACLVGMPAWQVLPLLASYGRVGVYDTGLLALLYWGVAVAALPGRPLGYRVLAAGMAL